MPINANTNHWVLLNMEVSILDSMRRMQHEIYRKWRYRKYIGDGGMENICDESLNVQGYYSKPNDSIEFTDSRH